VPFLRVLRDKRGYETTYLMHWFREGNRQRSRILYVFRTPPGVKVGRDPIDPQIIREIEAQHPDIEFDWRALRENQQVIDTSLEPRRVRSPRTSPRAEPAVGRKRRKEEDEEKAVASPSAAEAAQVPAAPRAEIVARPRLNIPTTIVGTTREEQFVFLLKVYLDLRERVPHRIHDPIRREALVGLVERLNPEAWVGEEQVVAGLQHAAEALQRLSHIFSRRRKRTRRAKSAEAQPPEQGGVDSMDLPSETSTTAHFPDDASTEPDLGVGVSEAGSPAENGERDEVTNQRTGEPAYPQPNESTDQRGDEPTNLQTDEPADPRTNEPITERSDEPTNLRTDEPQSKASE
jgi:hypothetical protein